MSHPEQRGFFAAVAQANPDLVAGGRVLEIGSYSVNGDVRRLFDEAREYVGVDLVEGPNVDRVGLGHEVADPDAAYDLAISGECFEHDPFWEKTLANMVRLTRPGGVVAVSCASRGRVEHGTRRSDIRDSPGTQDAGLDHYRNLTRADLDRLPLDTWFSSWRSWYNDSTFDLYLVGVRAGAPSTAKLPTDEQIEALRHLMPLAHRAIRVPLRLLARTRVDEERYQDLVLPYWRFLMRLSAGRGFRSGQTPA
ncbi:class I SAM-dependent methyltransferase [Nocardioides solisilvae]|uniref:class I SAM-dependent methyltransferase n=1 Tax=Nocardioides solisilvae TaxID=1542435 RepID=UPI0013A5B38D|nr:methyltransferase domain-containing protein [Nocardioides solisilvae]